ncbi:MAG: hypothetical protein KF745_11675 [Phycisphaeraceae bacterium]|nr:hypothetical protein [Phycisphaeraceae bacterium]
MSDIARVLRLAAWRLWATSFVHSLVLLLAVAVGALIALRLTQRAVVFEVPWWTVAGWSGVGVLVGAVAWSVFARADRQAVARRVDEGADLRETLSTALFISRNDDPWSRLAVESAATKARGVNVRRAVPIAPPRFWPAPLALGLALLVVWLTVPNLDLFGRAKGIAAAKEQQTAIIEAKFQAESATAKVDDIIAKLGLDKDKGDDSASGRPEAKSAEEIRRDAAKRLTSLKERLEALKNSEKGQSLDAIRKDLKQLRTPGDGHLSELASQLSKGNFDQAAAELQKLAEKMQSGQLSEDQKAKLAAQMKSLQEQLAKLAQEKKELEDALEKAGLDKNLASNPEALKKALEEAQNLTEEQKQALEEMAKAQQQAAGMCQSMSDSMGQMAQGMGKEGLSKDGMEGLEGMMNEMAQLEQMAQEMAMADAAMQECDGSLAELAGFSDCDNPGMGECADGLADKMGTKPWEEGWNENTGWGQGGPGRSMGGGNIGEEEDETKFTKEKARTRNQGGPIISSRLVQGDQVKGESHAEFAAAVETAERSATEAIEGNLVPREYQDTVKHYFGRLAAKAKAEEIKTPSSTPAPAPEAAPKK